jgi:hypothetical protein
MADSRVLRSTPEAAEEEAPPALLHGGGARRGHKERSRDRHDGGFTARLSPDAFPSAPVPALRCRLPTSSIAVTSDEDAFTRSSGHLFEGGMSTEAELPTTYNLHGIAAVYRRRQLLVLRRWRCRLVRLGTYLDRINERADYDYMLEVRFAPPHLHSM